MADDAPDYQVHFDAVQQFQNGDAEAALVVINDFRDFLEGFVLLLRGGPVKRLTYSHRIFLSNFVKNSRLARSLKSRLPAGAAYVAAETALMTVSIQIRPIDTEDLRQEVNEIFLGTLKRYRSRDNQNYLIPYIQKSFPYALTRRVQALIKDPLVNLASDKILSIEGLRDMPGRYDDYVQPSSMLRSHREVVKHLAIDYEGSVAAVNEDDLGSTWLRGEDCHDVFEQLTYGERKLIKQFYFLEMTDAQIAKEMGVSYNTAIRRRHLIESKLKGLYQPPTCQYCQVEVEKAPLGRQPRQCLVCREIRRIERQRARRRS